MNHLVFATPKRADLYVHCHYSMTYYNHQYGGFHMLHGGTPKMDGLSGRIPSRNGWWFGGTPISGNHQYIANYIVVRNSTITNYIVHHHIISYIYIYQFDWIINDSLITKLPSQSEIIDYSNHDAL